MSIDRYTWLVKSKSFIQLVGAEYHLLKKSGSNCILKFYTAAILIVVILILTFYSTFYATKMLFHVLQVELLLAVFISCLFVFIYIFLLNTFSKQIRSDKTENETQPWSKKLRLANLVRVGFVIFMAFLIGKPIEISLFQNKLKSSVKDYQQRMFLRYEERMATLYKPDEQKLGQSLHNFRKQYNMYPSRVIDSQIKNIQFHLSYLSQQHNNDLSNARSRISRSDFLLYQIQTVSKHRLSWLISVVIICLFLIPGYLIYSISTNDIYYKLKRDWERKLISEEYVAFERWYISIFKEKFNIELVPYTVFMDPPFNEKRKPKPAYQTQEDFNKRYSSDSAS